MITAIDLHKLSQACASQSGLLNLRRTQLARNPQAGADLHPSNRLLAQRDLVQGRKLLGGQRGPEIRITLAQNRSHAAQFIGHPVVAGAIAVARNQSDSTFSAVAKYQALNLPTCQRQALGGLAGSQLAIHHCLYALESIQIGALGQRHSGLVAAWPISLTRKRVDRSVVGSIRADICTWPESDISTWLLYGRFVQLALCRARVSLLRTEQPPPTPESPDDHCPAPAICLKSLFPLIAGAALPFPPASVPAGKLHQHWFQISRAAPAARVPTVMQAPAGTRSQQLSPDAPGCAR